MSKKQVSSSVPQVLHVEQAVQSLVNIIPHIKSNPSTVEEQKLYEKYQKQIQHKLSLIKKSANQSAPKIKFLFLQLQYYLDSLIQCLLLDERTASLSIDVLRYHCLDSQLIDHGILIHQNLLPFLKQSFLNSPENQQKIIFLVKDLLGSPYNQKLIMYDENAIFIIQNLFQIETAPEEYDYLFQCGLNIISTLSQVDQQITSFLFVNILIDQIEQIQDEYYVSSITNILWSCYSEENIFNDELNQIQKLISLCSHFENEQIQQFLDYIKSLVAQFPEINFDDDMNLLM